MPSVNLAPGTKQVVAAQRRRRRLFFVTALVLFAVAAVWGGLFFYGLQLSTRTEAVREEIRGVQAEIARLASDAERVQLFEDRLAAVSSLLNGHIEWETVLQGIERLLPTTVTLTDLQVNADSGGVVVSGRTTDIDQVSLALASFLADQSQTVFSGGELTSVQRKEVTGPEGSPPIVSYTFQILLSLRSSAVINAQL